MTTHVQHNELISGQAAAQLPRPSMVAPAAGVFLAALLSLLSPPLLVAGGLWMLGMGLALIGYALIVFRQYDTAVWGVAIVGQGLGLLGIALLFGASLLG
jgi:hypothetical protein